MKLFHLTSKKVYDEHIKREGLKPQQITNDFIGDDIKCRKGIFCWPEYTDALIHDWILFNKAKNGNHDDDFVLLEVQVAESALLGPPRGYDGLNLCHTFSVGANGSHGSTEIPLHVEVPLHIITKKVKPKDIVPIKEISTFVVVDCPKII